MLPCEQSVARDSDGTQEQDQSMFDPFHPGDQALLIRSLAIIMAGRKN